MDDLPLRNIYSNNPRVLSTQRWHQTHIYDPEKKRFVVIKFSENYLTTHGNVFEIKQKAHP